MFPRALALILIPCMLLNQSAALVHCHDQHDDHGHGSQAHIHFPWGITVSDEQQSSHGVFEQHCHSHDSHILGPSIADDHPTCFSDPESTAITQSINSTPFDHDAHCIYVSNVVAIQPTRLIFKEINGESGYQLKLIAWANGSSPQLTYSQRSCWPPPLKASACPLYLRHLSLLI